MYLCEETGVTYSAKGFLHEFEGVFSEYGTLVPLPQDHLNIKQKQKSHNIPCHLGDICMLHVVTRMCVSVCIRVLFYLKRLVTLSAHLGQKPVQVTQSSHLRYHSSLQTQRSTARPRSSLQPLGTVLLSQFSERKAKLERCKLSYNSLFDTKGP